MLHSDTINYMNELGSARIPFVFIIDFEAKCPLVYPLDKIPINIKFTTPGYSNAPKLKPDFIDNYSFVKEPISYASYAEVFHAIKKEIVYGNSYLLNLTFPTPISTNLSLEQIFHHSDAPYKLLVKDKFVCFSPEIFVRMESGKIRSYPMKGTIHADVKDAAEILLNDEKERAEHATIVDLIRNDLSMVSHNVKVNRYRYLDEITTHEGNLFQMSSEIEGELDNDYHKEIGTILNKLLPAGSISGAPKIKTMEIIRSNEIYNRGYYTGIFGVFNGWDLESAVMIRFIESLSNGLVFKSGGGITAMSDSKNEFEEMIAKVYVPIT